MDLGSPRGGLSFGALPNPLRQAAVNVGCKCSQMTFYVVEIALI